MVTTKLEDLNNKSVQQHVSFHNQDVQPLPHMELKENTNVLVDLPQLSSTQCMWKKRARNLSKSV